MNRVSCVRDIYVFFLARASFVKKQSLSFVEFLQPSSPVLFCTSHARPRSVRFLLNPYPHLRKAAAPVYIRPSR